MAASNTQRLAAARSVRAGGRWRYTWRYSLLRLWLPITVVAALILSALGRHAPAPAGLTGLPVLVQWLLLLAPIALLGSVLWGAWMWRLYERHWFPHLEPLSPEP